MGSINRLDSAAPLLYTGCPVAAAGPCCGRSTRFRVCTRPIKSACTVAGLVAYVVGLSTGWPLAAWRSSPAARFCQTAHALGLLDPRPQTRPTAAPMRVGAAGNRSWVDCGARCALAGPARASSGVAATRSVFEQPRLANAPNVPAHFQSDASMHTSRLPAARRRIAAGMRPAPTTGTVLTGPHPNPHHT